MVSEGPQLRSVRVGFRLTHAQILLDFDEGFSQQAEESQNHMRVTVDGSVRDAASPNLGSRTLEFRLIDLRSRIPAGAPIELSYQDPSSGNDTLVIEDTAGNDAPSFCVRGTVNADRSTVTVTGFIEGSPCPTSRMSRGLRQAPPSEPLTAELAGLPESHGGEAFTFEVRFSEPLSIGYKTLRDSVFAVTNGAVTRASRINGSNRNWEIEVEPSGSGDTTISLPPTTDCAATGAICVDGRRLSTAFETIVLHTLPEPVADPGAELTVAFETEPPAEHDGSSEIAFRIAFSENLDPYSYKTLRDASLSIYQGATRLTPKVKRLTDGSNRRWEVKVTPVSKEFLSIGLGPTHDCTDNGAMCTEDDRPLSHVLRWVVLGPPALSVADASVQEADGAVMEFAVTLSRASASTITVDYATSEGSATPGSDYTETSGTLTFAPDDTTKTVSVPVLNDHHNDGGETFTLTLSDASGGNAYIADATATGTIENTDHMPQAWLARFGRTVAEQVIEAVEGRMAASPAPGVRMSIGGRALDFGPGSAIGRESGDPGSGSGAGGAGSRALAEEEARSRLAAMTQWLRGTDEEDRKQSGPGSVSVRDLLTGSSFAVTAETGQGGLVSLWGRGAVSRFDGREDDLTLEGEVTGAMLGADWAGGPDGRGAWTAGLLVSRSGGEGSYRGGSETGVGAAGTVSSSVIEIFEHVQLGTAVSRLLKVRGARDARLYPVNGGGIMLHRKRPVGRVAAAQNCASDAPLSVWSGAGDVWGGALRSGTTCGCRGGSEPFRGRSAVRDRPSHGEEDAELFGASGLSAPEAGASSEAGRVHRDRRCDPGGGPGAGRAGQAAAHGAPDFRTAA